MSTRQKSFFEQNNNNKAQNRTSWRRPQDASHAHQLDRGSAMNKTILPPLRASSPARAKLKAFQFIEGRPKYTRAPESEKENQPPSTEAEGDFEQDLVAAPEGRQCNESSQSKLRPPSTPATRLPLAELVGNAEDAAKQRRALNISPEEHISWEGSEPNRTSARRGRKRARSSSPLQSSSQTEAQKHLPADNGPFDVQQLQSSLKTPRADPAADLWSRYSSDVTSKCTPKVAQAPTFAHLIDRSSPTEGAGAGSVGGLRRWASCGIEWPTSRAKRRKVISSFHGQAKNDAGDKSDAEACPAAQTQLSKVSLLVERVHESLIKPVKEDLNGPSSSSPLPESVRRHGGQCASPLAAAVCRMEQRKEAFSRGLEDGFRGHENDIPEADEPQSSSSAFDNVDLEAYVEKVGNDRSDRHSKELQYGLQLDFKKMVAEAPSEPGLLDESLASAANQHKQSGAENEFDEFGSEEDHFAADLENLASMYDISPDLEYDTEPALPLQDQQGVPPIRLETSNEPTMTGLAGTVGETRPSDDEFGDDDIDIEHFTAAEAATQSFRASNPTQNSSDKQANVHQRYLISKIVEGHYTSDKGLKKPEKVLVVQDERSKLLKAVTLRQSWVDTPCTAGSYVHVCGEFTSTGQCTIDDSHGLLILHPDHLISVTVVADSIACTRRAVLQHRIKATGSANAPQVHGHILHELFQEAMAANRWDDEWLQSTLTRILPRYFESILDIGSSVPAVVDHINSKWPEMRMWAEVFVKASPSDDALVKDRNGGHVTMAVRKLLDVEEHVWSPRYGLKGNIDATVELLLKDESGEFVLAVPFELKTGRNNNNPSHLAQTALYTLLVSDRYDINVTNGILYYLENSDTRCVRAVRHELVQMIMRRNELACYVRERVELPPVLNDSHLCRKCYAQTSCFVYHRLAESGTGERLAPRDEFDRLVRQLGPRDQAFFKKWDFLLTKEESEMVRYKRELWTMRSTEREKLGRCFSNVIIQPGTTVEDDDAKIIRFKYTLVRHGAASDTSFTDSQITVGEPIVISDEKGHLALANGFVTQVRKRRITVAVDRRLHSARTRRPGFDAERNQVFAGIMDATGADGVTTTTDDGREEPIIYRLDKDEFSNGMATVRNNLVQIMVDDVFKAREIRSLIVGDEPPCFKPSPAAYSLRSQMSQMDLNEDQAQAIDKVMSAKDYALVLGMPGTGKTTTIAHIIRALVSRGKSVLLTSYTHTAVDNILLKIRRDKIDILRIGAKAKVHPEVQEFAILSTKPKKTLEELEKSWYEPPVVATTCLGVSHPIFTKRIFDYCIVDEASQITLPVCLGPIRMAKTFVLVGDHFQLPPLVQNKEALEGGLDVSLFKSLSEKHPEAMVTLEHQYRMCSDIMMLANILIYDGRLKCGNEAVATRQLSIPHLESLGRFHRGLNSGQGVGDSIRLRCNTASSPECWILRALSPSNKVVFLNTDPLIPESLETASGARIVNLVESALTTQLVTALISVGISPADVGVITFYRSQLAVIKQSISHTHNVEMHTADRFQGRDKEVVIVSCVRSNVTPSSDDRNAAKAGVGRGDRQTEGDIVGNVGELLRDWRRVNVAITRARSKLILIGSAQTLRADAVLRKLLELCAQKGWLYDLPVGATEAHTFDNWYQTQGEGTVPQTTSTETETAQSEKHDALGKVQSPSGKPRKVLGATQGRVVSTKRQGKIAKNTGQIRKDGFLGTRPVIRDILNDTL